jgi:hypothetical protein
MRSRTKFQDSDFADADGGPATKRPTFISSLNHQHLGQGFAVLTFHMIKLVCNARSSLAYGDRGFYQSQKGAKR